MTIKEETKKEVARRLAEENRKKWVEGQKCPETCIKRIASGWYNKN